MSTIAAVAQTSDQIDYWIRRRVIQPCHQTHLSRSKLSPARDRSFWLSAIGQCLKDQHDALASSAYRCARQATRNAEIA